MHPYEVAQTLRSRGKHQSIRVNFGSLYSVVEGLEKRRLVTAVETTRQGNRPERTVYAITDAGRRELVDWLTEMVATPEKEYPRFEAALSLLPSLAPDDALAALQHRANALELELNGVRAGLRTMADMGLPRLFGIEEEFRVALLVAEIQYVRALVADLEQGDLEGLKEWQSWYETGTKPPSWEAPS
jgi:DNA-binding PadR family transcriptional regulator